MLRRLPEFERLGTSVVLLGSGSPAELSAFVEREDLRGRRVDVLTDPSLRAFAAAGLSRSRAAALSPKELWADLHAFGHGYRPHGRAGDPAQLGGALLLDGEGRVARAYRAGAPSELVDLNDFIHAALVMAAARGTAAGLV